MVQQLKQSPPDTKGLRGIGDRLREMFDAMTAGPIPDHLLDAVDQLERAVDKKEQAAKSERSAVLIPA